MGSERLDVYVSKQYNISRHQAALLIREGKVTVNQKVQTKPSCGITDNDIVTAKVSEYVSRAANKLKAALEYFSIPLSDNIVADIGASTGGFTQVALQAGARHVYAIDVGHAQLHDLLRNDPRVTCMEGINARFLRLGDLPSSVDFVCCDASFISVTLLLDAIYDILQPDGKAIILVKPQFEAGSAALSSGGVVRQSKDHVKVLEKVMAAVLDVSMSIAGLYYSPVIGEAGNIEYLLYLQKNTQPSVSVDIHSIVQQAFDYAKKEGQK